MFPVLFRGLFCNSFRVKAEHGFKGNLDNP